MPLKFGAGRRKSSANVLDTSPEAAAPPQSSFRVLERVEKINLNAQPQQNGSRQPVQRPFNSPLASLRGKSAEELGSTLNRGSGGTTASGGSSGYYESSSASARHSSSSTLPSSVDAEREPREDELFPKKTKTAPLYRNHAADIDELPPPPTKSFTSRAARALSFGQKHNRSGSGTEINHVPPIPPAPSWPAQPARSHSPKRDRALTTSSYASTAKPEPLTLSSDFGGDFGNMFASSTHPSPSPPPPVASQHKTESQPIYPPRTASRQFATSRPSPDFLARERNDAGSPYSWDSRNSNEGLMTSSALSSPRLDAGPPVPPHKGGMASDFLRGPKAGYSLVPDRQSPGLPPARLSQDSRDAFISDNEKESDSDEYASDKEQSVKGVQLRDTQQSQSASSASFASASSNSSLPTRKPPGMPAQATAGASRAGAMSPESSEGGGSLWGAESMNATPKAQRLNLARNTEDSLFDSSPQGPPSRAIRPGTQHARTESGTPKKMTKAQFERLQRGGESSADQSDEDAHSEDDYEDEDDVERAKKLARQRQKQEANMSVYRQQMKKVTGGGPSDLPSAMPRPSLDRASASAPAAGGQGGIHFGGMGGQPPPETIRGKQSDEDDDDVPLGILQAHGFPSGSRPPTRQEGDGMNQRRASAAGSVMGGGAGQGNLPPFARRLPADPYFGSSLVNQGARESLGFGGAPSVHGGAPQQMQPQMGHPGGLVGVIAGEERAKAARRGSPNMATGSFNTGMPLPQNMPNMPNMPRTMSMGNVTAPQVYTPNGMPGMPPMPGMMPGMLPGMMPGMPGMQQMPPMQNQSQDQMQKFMEMQMQIMQNMLSMQQVQMGQTPQPQQQPAGDYLGVNFGQPGTTSGQPGAPSINGGFTPSINQGRAMTMMNPPKGWDTPPGGVRPNSAMPATYAPSGYNFGGPAPGYTPSIAPSERSNVGMPSRYRPVETNGNNSGRSQSMTSSLTLQAFNNNTNRQLSPDTRPQTAYDTKPKASTVRLIDKPKGAPKVTTKPVADEEDDDGWAEMKKKREDKKRFRFGRKSPAENTLGDLYRSYD